MPSKTQSILLGALTYAVVNVVLSVIAQGAALGTAGGLVFALLGCLIALAIAALPVWHYTSMHNLTLRAGPGAGMGAMAIAIGVIIAAVLQYSLIAAGLLADPQEAMMDQWEAAGMGPDEIEMAQRLANPLITTAIGIVFGAVIGAVGGAIGASIFKKGGDAV